MIAREVQAAALPAVRELGIGFVPNSPPGRGLPTSAVTPHCGVRPVGHGSH